MDINCILFDGFETLDAFGPVEILGMVEEYHIRFFSYSGGIVSSRQNVPIVTKPMREADPAGILLIPGGKETRAQIDASEFIKLLGEMAEKSAYCLTVCTGSALLAKTGLLENREATSNKMAFDWVAGIAPDVKWLRRARWAVDGKYYTSSGVSAGMDMALGFLSDRFGRERASTVARIVEYMWNDDKDNDPFAASAT